MKKIDIIINIDNNTNKYTHTTIIMLTNHFIDEEDDTHYIYNNMIVLSRYLYSMMFNNHYSYRFLNIIRTSIILGV